MARKERTDPKLVAQRAKSRGWERGEHAERDKERGRTHFDDKTIRQQDHVLGIYLAWCLDRLNGEVSVEECEAKCLGPGAPLPAIHELKDFWRFYASQADGRIVLSDGRRSECPTATTLRGRAKMFKGGFTRRTGNELDDEDTREINRWLKEDLPYEQRKDGARYCCDIQKPKYNFQLLDLGRLLDEVWAGQDIRHIHDRNRLQFHLQLIWFCHSGARRGALLEYGVPYKVITSQQQSFVSPNRLQDIHLVLSSDQGEPRFLYRLAQRHVKNNKDPDNRTFGDPCMQHPVLRYDSVSILLMLAVVDGALDREDLTRMIENGGEGQVEWNEQCRDLPVCRRVDKQGAVDDTKPMTDDVFIEMFQMFLMQAGYSSVPGYLLVPGSIHMIRRELGKQLDARYTEVERSQHLTQADKAVFGQSYTADTSSCDGLSAFLREKPDHRAVEYFQGLTQFRHDGLPTRLPAALKDEVRHNSEIVEWDRKIAQASDAKTRKWARQKRQKALDRSQKLALEGHRRERLAQLKRERLLNGRHAQAPRSDPDPLHMLRPEKARLAQKMASTLPASRQDKLDAMRDMLSLLAASTVFYLPGEEPKNGQCPYCPTKIESITNKRHRCKHIHGCRKKAVAHELLVLPSKLKFCYFCNLFFTGDEWEGHCRDHLSEPLKHYGSITFRHTLIRPAFCLLCRQSEHLSPGTRMQSWERDADAIRHMEEAHAHEWPWSCLECDFSGDGEACYYHLHDVHSYQLAKKRKFGTPSSDTDVSPGDKSDDWMSEFIRYSPSSPELSVTDIGASEPLPCISPSLFSNERDDRDELPVLEEQAKRLRKEARCETRVSWKPEGEHVQVGISQKEGAKDEGNYIDITCDAESLPETQQDLHPLDASSLDPYIGNSVMAPANDLDLAFTARSSLSLLESCPSDTLLSGMLAGRPPTTEFSLDEDQEAGLLGRSNLDPSSAGQAALMSPPPSRSPTATVTDMNPTGFEPSPHCPSPRLATPPVSQTMSPCAASNTGSTMPGQVTPGGKKRRIKIITASCNRSENTDDVESPPPRKKCRITLKTRPWIQKNEHAGDAKAPPWEERRNKQTKVSKPTSKRIILNKQTKGAEPMWAILDKQTQVAKPTKTRIILKTGSRRLHKRSRINGDS
ncbi:hypothetical protein B0J13DRAFT_673061 [Dactylonectria estremocensis]|uniref:Uncharacterized protein n=1 Tax=Dactylonectria estremocensis TaxID=1079267 RepID=A0A9P9DUA5_9HYPO|nr:hypothetical protein B0J13DRAFT_679540 [Dactylonectria estremocensis]KAH7151972.1 hypothetical protein B0J13DRAFT_673061 [Dactylonectria estremocensis]